MKNTEKQKQNNYPLRWDLSDLGKSIDDPYFQKERKLHERKIKAFAKKWKADPTYLKEEKKLKEALDDYNHLAELPDREAMYLFLRRQVETENKELLSAENRYVDFSQKLSDEMRFFLLSLGKIEKAKQKSFLKSPLLQEYRHFLEGIFASAKYQLSEKEERILSLQSGVSSAHWEAMVSDLFSQESAEVLVKEGSKRVKKRLPFHEILANLKSDCSRVRKSAAQAVNAIFRKHQLVVEREFNAMLEAKKINDLLRGFKRPDSARILSDDISEKIVDSLSEAVADYFSLSRDFYRFKAKLMKKDKLNYYDRLAPSLKLKERKAFSYEEAIRIVGESFSALDDDFSKIFYDMLQKGRVDVYPRKGKRGGAFCMYHGKQEPVYIMLNHTNKSGDVMTLAHEMGHAIHGTLAKQEKGIYYDTPMFTAETASTFCEGIVFDRLVHELSERERLVLLIERLEDIIATTMRQIAAYRFERDIHHLFRQKAYLSTQEIGGLFKKHMSAYMGNAIEQNFDAENWWMHWSHFRSPFYVYSYASGLLLSSSMRALLKKDPENWKRIKKFFYTGTSKSPKKIFQEMGIQLEKKDFWLAGLEDIELLFKETKRLAKKLGKL